MLDSAQSLFTHQVFRKTQEVMLSWAVPSITWLAVKQLSSVSEQKAELLPGGTPELSAREPQLPPGHRWHYHTTCWHSRAAAGIPHLLPRGAELEQLNAEYLSTENSHRIVLIGRDLSDH